MQLKGSGNENLIVFFWCGIRIKFKRLTGLGKFGTYGFRYQGKLTGIPYIKRLTGLGKIRTYGFRYYWGVLTGTPKLIKDLRAFFDLLIENLRVFVFG